MSPPSSRRCSLRQLSISEVLKTRSWILKPETFPQMTDNDRTIDVRTTMRSFLPLVLALLAVPSCLSLFLGAPSKWRSPEIKEFFKKDCGVTIEDDIAAKLTPRDLLDGSLLYNDRLGEIGVDSALDRSRVKQGLWSLQAKVTRMPTNFDEWRLSNRRLSDMWLIPLASSPRFLLLWLRFFHSDEFNALDIHDASIDETPLQTFILQLVFVPNWPIFKAMESYADSDIYTDDVMKFVTRVRLVADIMSIINLVYDPIGTIRMVLLSELMGLISALLSYFVLWFITPIFVLDFLYYAFVYVIVPSYALLGILSGLTLMGMIPNLLLGVPGGGRLRRSD